MKQYSPLWNAVPKPFLEGYFVLPKAIGRAAIRDGSALEDERNRRHHTHAAERGDIEDEQLALVSLSVH